MRKKLILPAFLAALTLMAASCNSSEENVYETTTSSSVLVSKFYIKDNSSVLDNLSNVYFSIDLENGKIFNAEPLPYGTPINRLIPGITMSNSASAMQLRYYCPETERDSIVDFLTNSTDSIDFSAGPVILTVTSESGLVTRDYEITVNVFDQKSDSLFWYSMETSPMPSAFGRVVAQKTVKAADRFITLSSDGTNYSMATSDNVAAGVWSQQDITFPFEPLVSSLTCADDKFYVLSVNGDMYQSADMFAWTATGTIWKHIYGVLDGNLYGASCSGDAWTICEYPGGRTWPMPSTFPVSGTSHAIVYDTPMAYSPQMVFVGGRLADGSLTGDAWGFDGSNWGKVSSMSLPEAMENITLVSYKLSETFSSDWVPVSYPVLLTFGGKLEDGTNQLMGYYSRDWGMTWREAPQLIQMPEEIPALCGADAYVESSVMHVESRSNLWTPVQLPTLPPFCQKPEFAASRADKPITEWDCPYIYMFGGWLEDGTHYDNIWRAVLMLFTYKPVQ